jgi:excisionase family DNA binding protein
VTTNGTTPPSDRLTLSVPEAANILGISRAFAYELVARRELPSKRLGGRILIPRAALDAMLDAVAREWA